MELIDKIQRQLDANHYVEAEDIQKLIDAQKWVAVEDRLPELERPVWMYVGEKIMLGCRSNYANEGWLWCRLDSQPYYSKRYIDMHGFPWDFDPISDDDYQPTHWKPLPEPPTV